MHVCLHSLSIPTGSFSPLINGLLLQVSSVNTVNYGHCSFLYYALKIWNSLPDHINPFAPGDFAEKRVLKLVEWFSGHCRAIKS